MTPLLNRSEFVKYVSTYSNSTTPERLLLFNRTHVWQANRKSARF